MFEAVQRTRGFSPRYGSGQAVAVTTSASTPASLGDIGQCEQVFVYNSGAADCFVRFALAAENATTLDMPVKAGAYFVMNLPYTRLGVVYVSAITASGSTTLQVMPGIGQ
jgi:hypothetical protein